MIFMCFEWWLSEFDYMQRCSRNTSKSRSNDSRNGEELSRRFTNRSETSAFYGTKVELSTEMQWAYLSTRARRV